MQKYNLILNLRYVCRIFFKKNQFLRHSGPFEGICRQDSVPFSIFQSLFPWKSFERKPVRQPGLPLFSPPYALKRPLLHSGVIPLEFREHTIGIVEQASLNFRYRQLIDLGKFLNDQRHIGSLVTGTAVRSRCQIGRVSLDYDT